eukprot:CAMPEP_0197693666 /NCGR_PEP_ID=MMETSP1338-20131121/112831_1 /TAXON_ID=43686 ORGANISM="Pelagodinium beii, Strain RCC1491" /NCGR_SAMPLE_ID=MMETSP1338 /ASSEMBLY_ACC=CAM_ASM_000754 /LENGTH=67 /DNA_ID=CAMNT_0043276445 /DNA_START=36 /DNA_END=236 /DNA_ORIENTATION=+
MEEMKKEAATKQLLLAMSSTDLAYVEKAILTAKEGRVSQDMQQKAEARCRELKASHAMRDYLGGHLK